MPNCRLTCHQRRPASPSTLRTACSARLRYNTDVTTWHDNAPMPSRHAALPRVAGREPPLRHAGNARLCLRADKIASWPKGVAR